MKSLLLLMLVCTLQTVSATDYYFSSTSGNDSYSSAQAQNPNTPWRSIDKLNSLFYNLAPGDVIHLKRGDVFYGSITVARSGASGQPITITAYGQGARPVITGFISLTDWVPVGNGIWQSYSPALGDRLNKVVLNGVTQAMGRYPNSDAGNKGWLRFENFVANSSITDNELNSSINWTGGEVVIRKRLSVIDRLPITNHVGTTIWYYGATASYPPADKGYGYFVQNHINTLDQLGEWYYNPSVKVLYMYFGANAPSSYHVQASAVDNVIYSKHKSNILYDNLTITGADENGIAISEGTNNVVRLCDLTLSGQDGIQVYDSPNFRMENCNVSKSNNNGINLGNGGTYNAAIVGNMVEGSGVFPGMGKSGDGNNFGIYSNGNGNRIEYNQVLNTGYSGILFLGDNVTVKNNYVNNFCFVKDDGAGIYTYGTEPTQVNFGRRVIGNIVLNGIGAPHGSPDNSYRSEGLFLDGFATGVEVRDNTFANCSSYGLFTNSVTNMIITGNTFYNNQEQLHMIRFDSRGVIRDNAFGNNIFFSKEKTQLVASINSIAEDIPNFGSFDNNFYARPLDDNMTIRAAYVTDYGVDLKSNVLDLHRWKVKSGKDYNSQKSPIQIPEYTVHNVIGGNKFANGQFNSGLGNFWYWAAANNISASWATGRLDGGSAQISFQSPPNSSMNQALSYQKIGEVVAGKSYKLNFSLLGSNDDVTVDIFLRNANAPYNRLSEIKHCKISSNRTENEYILTASAYSNDATLVFEVNDQNVHYWLDNIELYEANVTLTNPNDHIRFEYNPTGTAVTIALNGAYVDVKNNYYAGSVVLAPYASVVLIKHPGAQNHFAAKADQTINFAPIPSTTLGAGAISLNAAATSGLPVTYSVVSGSATLSGNTVTITGAGNVTIQATQAGNDSYNPASPVAQSFSVALPPPPPSAPDQLQPAPPAPVVPTPLPPSAPPASTCSGTGGLTREEWGSADGDFVNHIPTNKAAHATHLITSFETVNTNENFGARIRGYICAPQSGNYTFWISGDDGVELWLSTDDNPGNKRRIGGYNGYTAFHEWNKYSFQQSPTIYLEAGRRYYIEALHKGGRGVNHMSVQWQLPSGIVESPIPGNRVAPYGASAPSAPAPSCSGTGGILREEWGGVNGDAIASIPTQKAPHAAHVINAFEIVNTNGNFGARMRGYVCPPQSGNYTFWVSGDDHVELWLSGDENPSGKRKIAGFAGYTAFRDYSKYASQQSATIYLEAGRRYYIEALHKGGNGPNHFSVEWQLPNTVMEAPIPGNRLVPYSEGNNGGGSVRSMSTNEVTESNSTPAIATLSTYPNPVKTVGTIQVTPTVTEDATIELYTTQGKLVKRLFRGRVEAGVAKNLTLNAQGLKNGLYVVRFTSKTQTLSNKVILAR